MKISLRKANAIQSAIQEEMNSLDLTTDVQISEFEKPSVKLEEAQKRFFDNMEIRSKLLKSLFEIRAAVSGANASNGINGLLAILAQNEKEIGLYNKLSRLQAQIDIDIVRGKLAKIKGRADEAYRYGDDDVATNIFNDATIQTFKSKLASLKKEKQKLQDELLELNVRTEILLSSETENTLKSFNIL